MPAIHAARRPPSLAAAMTKISQPDPQSRSIAALSDTVETPKTAKKIAAVPASSSARP